MGSQKYFLYKPHKLSWALSQTLYPTYYPTWVFTKILITLLPKLGHKIILSSLKDLNSFTLWAKPKKPNKTFLQSPLLHDASKSLLLYDTLKPVATWQYFYKMSKGPILLWHLFTKAQYYFGIYLQKPKYYKNPILFWHLFTKAQYYFGTYLQKPKYYFDKNNYIILEAQNYSLAKTYFHILKSLTHRKYKLPVPQKYFFYKIYGNYAYFFSIIN